MEISTNIDMRMEFLELEIKPVIGASRIMIDTWHAEVFMHGLDEAAGSEMFTKLCVKLCRIERGRLEFIV
jgi:hypothetical protein